MVNFLDEVKDRNVKGLQLGIDLGWWEAVDWNRMTPIPFPDVVVLSTKELRRRNHRGLWETIGVLEDHETSFAHVVAKFGLFESVGDAKKNGCNRPIEVGEHWFKKKTKRVVVLED